MRDLWRRTTSWLSAPRRRWLRLTLITVVGTFTVAMAALVLEDAVPPPGQDRQFSTERWSWLMPSLGLLLLLVTLQARRDRDVGTFLYLRYLPRELPDVQVSGAWSRRVDDGYLDGRAVRRVIPPGTDDLVDDLERYGAAVEAELNQDTLSTGLTIAPNLLWPTAMATGYDLMSWAEPRLVELDWTRRDGVRPSEEAESGTGSTPLEFEWNPNVRPNRRFTGHRRPFDTLYVTPCPPTDASVQLVDFVVEISIPAKYRPQSPLAPIDWCGDVQVRIGAQQSQSGKTSQVFLATKPPRRRDDPVTVHPWIAAQQCAHTLLETLHTYPEAVVAVRMRTPKTIAFAMGWLMRHQQLLDPTHPELRQHVCPEAQRGERCPTCESPWRRLILLNFVGPQQPYQVMRVHPHQPTIDASVAIIEGRRSHASR